MLLNVAKTDDFASNLEAKSFEVEMNAMLFHSVINGIYADKIRSPMRELATNARDGHALAGKLSEPFDITLPTAFNPVFIVRDYGVSMSHEEMMGLYSTLFASSKRESNEAVGMIGLGSKSPFAYVSSFTVTAWQDGIRRDYAAFLNADNMPQLAPISSLPSDDPTGIEVTMAVQISDIATFRDAANQVFFGFDPKPNIKDFEFKEFETSYDGKGYTLYTEGQSGYPWPGKAMARQGCVIYPLDPQALGPRFKDNPIWNMSIIVDFPIGELSVNTSREALGYDAQTISNVEARMATVLDDMTNIVQKEIDDQPDYLHACKIFSAKRSTNVIYKTLGGTLKYRGGELVRFQLRAGNLGDHYRMRIYDSSHRWVGSIPNTVSFAQVKNRTFSTYYAEGMIDSIVILDIENEAVDNIAARIRRVFSQSANKTVFWLKADTMVDADEVVKQLGYPETVNLKDVTPLILPRASVKRRKEFLTFYKFRPQDLEGELMDISNDVIIPYVYNEGRYCYYDGSATNGNYGRRDVVYSRLKQLTDIIDDQDLNDLEWYAANMNFLQRMEKKKTVTMVPLSDFISEAITKTHSLDEIAKFINDHEINSQYRYVPYNIQNVLSWLKTMKSKRESIPDAFAAFLTTFSDEKLDGVVDVNPLTKYIDVKYTLKSLFPKPFADPANKGVKILTRDEDAEYKSLCSRYPLLTQCNMKEHFFHYMELLNK